MNNSHDAEQIGVFRKAWRSYRLRMRRRRLLLRAFLKRKELNALNDQSGNIKPSDHLCFVTCRNEMTRLPWFLKHHRALGIQHFLFVDNNSDDGTAEFLAAQEDCSSWTTTESYKSSRFGMDWLGWLMFKHGHGHWCLTLDVDETLIYPDWPDTPLPALTEKLDQRGATVMSAMMLDMYPKGKLSQSNYHPGTDPTDTLQWFDPDGYDGKFLPKYRNKSIRGGVRKRFFFQDRPEFAPHLDKIPLIKWNRRYIYVSSTHIALPRFLNNGFEQPQGQPTGVLLHSKFIDEIIEKSAEEMRRKEHFTTPDNYDTYYQRIVDDPDLWYPGSARYEGWKQLVDLKLMSSFTF